MAETFLAVLSSRPLAVLAALPSLRHGRAGLKASLAEIEAWRETGLATDFPKD